MRFGSLYSVLSLYYISLCRFYVVHCAKFISFLRTTRNDVMLLLPNAYCIWLENWHCRL